MSSSYIKVHSTLPRTLQDWYQNVAQDVTFWYFRCSQENNIGEIGFLTIFVQPCDENMSVSGMGGGDA